MTSTPEPQPTEPPALADVAHERYQAAMPFRAYLTYPGPPDAYGTPTEAEIPMVLVRGLDVGGQRCFHAFGPAGHQLPPTFRAMLDPMPDDPNVHVRFEIVRGPFGPMVFAPPWQMRTTNN